MLDVVHGSGALRRLQGWRRTEPAPDGGGTGGAAAYPHRRWEEAYSFTLEPGALRALDHAGEAFIAAQLERNFRTLDYYKSLIY